MNKRLVEVSCLLLRCWVLRLLDVAWLWRYCVLLSSFHNVKDTKNSRFGKFSWLHHQAEYSLTDWVAADLYSSTRSLLEVMVGHCWWDALLLDLVVLGSTSSYSSHSKVFFDVSPPLIHQLEFHLAIFPLRNVSQNKHPKLHSSWYPLKLVVFGAGGHIGGAWLAPCIIIAVLLCFVQRQVHTAIKHIIASCPILFWTKQHMSISILFVWMVP